MSAHANIQFLPDDNDLPMDRLLTSREVASILRIERHRLSLLVNGGELATVRLGQKAWRFRPGDVRRFIESRVSGCGQ